MYRLVDLNVKDFKIIRKRVVLKKELLSHEVSESRNAEEMRSVLKPDVVASRQLLSQILKGLPNGSLRIALFGRTSVSDLKLLKVIDLAQDIRSGVKSMALGGKNLFTYLLKLIDENDLRAVSFKILSRK